MSNKKSNPEEGVSIIICSKDSFWAERILDNIKKTVGVVYELIVFDNRINWGISKVYNHCAKNAKYSYLCFIHEDVKIYTSLWGKIIIDFINNTPNCGVIGVAGGIRAHKNFVSWYDENCGRYHYYEFTGENKKNYSSLKDFKLNYNNPYNENFSKVITLDGVFLFVRKNIWEKNNFDEISFDNFHFYDSDFTFSINQNYQNYSCLIIDIYHFSGGIREKNYYEYMRKFQIKWKKNLPYMINSQKISLADEFHKALHLFSHLRHYGTSFVERILHVYRVNGFFFVFLFYFVLLFHYTNRLSGNHLNSKKTTTLPKGGFLGIKPPSAQIK